MSEILVISSCTATKSSTTAGTLLPAEVLYGGQHHLRLMRGVRDYRAVRQPAGRLRLRIVSAFHGVLAPTRRIAPYDYTFAGLPVAAVRSEARERGVPGDTRLALSRPFALGVLLLSDPYLQACDLDAELELGGPVVAFCSPAAARRLPPLALLRPVALANAEAHRFSCGLTALKGELGGRLLSRLSREPDVLARLVDPATDVLAWLESSARREPNARRVA